MIPPDEPAPDAAAPGRAAPPPEEPPGVAHTLPEAREITRARARDLVSMLRKYVRRHLPAAPAAPQRTPEPPRMTGRLGTLLKVLRLIPWALGGLFAFSFFWDFPNARGELFGQAFDFQGLLRITSVSGLIGFYTNWLAIAMLFHPRERRPIFGQGLIPAQRERVIFRLAQAVSKELINADIIKRKIEESGAIARYREQALGVVRGVLEDPEFRGDLKALTADYVDRVLGSEEVRRRIIEFTVQRLEQTAGPGLGGLALRTYRFFNEADFQRRLEAAIHALPQSVEPMLDGMDQMLDRLPEKIEARSGEIENWATQVVLGFVEKLDVYAMIVENMHRYDEQQLETLLKNASNEQLDYIKYLGGILGLFGGLVIWRPLLSLVVFGLLGLGLYAVDEAVYRRRVQGSKFKVEG